MYFKRTLAAAAAAALVAIMPASAQSSYPDQAITIVVPYAPGGGGDTFTRTIADLARDILGVNVNVENRAGGGATIGVGSVARANPDGYTIGFVSTSPVVVAPNFSRVPYDPATDLTYLARFVTSPHPMVVRADSQWQTYEDLVAWVKENPGRLRWSTAGVRGGPHIATEAAFRTEGLNAVFVPMQGSSEVLAGLLGDTLDVGVISDFAVPLQAGDVRVLAESGPEKIASLPEIPTYSELGYPLAPSIFFGLIGPANLPDEVVAKWEDTLKQVVEDERFKEVARRLNANISYLGHEEFQASVVGDIKAMATTLEDLGMLEQ